MKLCLFTLLGKQCEVEEKIALRAIKLFPECVAVTKCSQTAILKAVDRRPDLVSVVNLDESEIKCIVRENPQLIYLLENPSYEICNIAMCALKDSQQLLI